jgi:hypothetical protein
MIGEGVVEAGHVCISQGIFHEEIFLSFEVRRGLRGGCLQPSPCRVVTAKVYYNDTRAPLSRSRCRCACARCSLR